jgi:ABC-type lipoprotein release transport system permease subunit
MLLQLAWKNIWRNKKRSTVIIFAILLGLWAGLFSGATMMGMAESMVNSAIERYLGHIQIHTKKFREDKQIGYNLKDLARIRKILSRQDLILAFSERTILEGMAASAASSFGVQITGIDRDKETKVIGLNKKIIEGGFLESKRKNQILIGKKLAERLNLKMRSKIILTFQDKKGEIIYLACRITGIFKTESSTFDESTVFLKQSDLLNALHYSRPLIHEIAIRVKSTDFAGKIEDNLKAALPALKIESWKNLAPELAFISSSMEAFTYLFVSIILFALLFGITNNMLMSVMERTRELGILTAVGMRKSRIFIMILSETIMLSLTGGILGMISGSLSIDYFNGAGIDLSAFASGLENFGSGTMLYPFLPAPMYVGLTLMIFIAANIAAILPAWKATHLVPAEAIRTY